MQRLKELSLMGIKSTVLIHKRDEEEKEHVVKETGMLASKVTSDFY